MLVEKCLKQRWHTGFILPTANDWLRMPENSEKTSENTPGLNRKEHFDPLAMSPSNKEEGYGRSVGSWHLPCLQMLPEVSQSKRDVPWPASFQSNLELFYRLVLWHHAISSMWPVAVFTVQNEAKDFFMIQQWALYNEKFSSASELYHVLILGNCFALIS